MNKTHDKAGEKIATNNLFSTSGWIREGAYQSGARLAVRVNATTWATRLAAGVRDDAPANLNKLMHPR